MRRIDWPTTLFICITAFAAVILTPLYLYFYGWHWSFLFGFLLFWALTSVSITAGYHRCFSHRSYESVEWLRVFYLLFGAAAFQGSALKWCTDHRRHHQFVDTDKDPYNIKRGFWYAHLGWLFFDTPEEYKNYFASDLKKDRWMAFQHRYYLPIAIFMCFFIPILFGSIWDRPLGGLVFSGILRLVVTHHCTFFINSLCHMVGKQSYSDSHSARDSFILAFLTYGEGYHNFHHEFQVDYRNGVRWYQWDPTKWTIQILALLGCAKKLRTISREAIIHAKILQDEKRLSRCGISNEKVAQLKARVVQAQVDLKKLREDFLVSKKKFQLRSGEQFLGLKADLRVAKLEFEKSYAQWKSYIRILSSQRA